MLAGSGIRETISKHENGTPKVAKNAFNIGEVWNPVHICTLLALFQHSNSCLQSKTTYNMDSIQCILIILKGKALKMCNYTILYGPHTWVTLYDRSVFG